jgi:hypothetical protein
LARFDHGEYRVKQARARKRIQKSLVDAIFLFEVNSREDRARRSMVRSEIMDTNLLLVHTTGANIKLIFYKIEYLPGEENSC